MVLRSWLLALLFWGSISASAHAFDFGWDAPAGCPTASFVEAEVTRIVGRPWQQLGASWRQAEGAITPEGTGFRLRLRVLLASGATSERYVIAASCTEATEAAVAILTASMALPESSEKAPEPASVDASASASASAVNAEAPVTTDVGASSDVGTSSELDRIALNTVFAARLGADFGTLAAPAPFAQVTLGVELDRFALLGFIGASGRVIGEIEGSAAGAQMFLLMGGLMGCYQLTLGNPSASGCAGVELGSLEASGFGTADGKDGRALWSASLGQAALDWNISSASAASLGVTTPVKNA